MQDPQPDTLSETSIFALRLGPRKINVEALQWLLQNFWFRASKVSK